MPGETLVTGPCDCESKYAAGVTPEFADFYHLTRHLPGCPNSTHILRQRRQKLLEKYISAAGELLGAAVQDRASFILLAFDPGGWQIYYTNVKKEVMVAGLKVLLDNLEKGKEEVTEDAK